MLYFGDADSVDPEHEFALYDVFFGANPFGVFYDGVAL